MFINGINVNEVVAEILECSDTNEAAQSLEEVQLRLDAAEAFIRDMLLSQAAPKAA